MYESQLKDTAMMAYCMNNIAYAFSENKQMDSSFIYYKKAYGLAKAQKNNKVTLHILGQIASYYTRAKDYETAYKYIKIALNDVDASSKSSFYSIASEVYMKKGQTDSAFFYCMKALEIGTVHAKQSACRRLMEMYLAKKDYDNSVKYLKLFKLYTDSVNTITTTESVNRINSLYNYNLREKENLMLKAKSSNILSFTFAIISLLCVTISIFIIYIFRSRQKEHIQEERFKRIKKELLEQSEEYIKDNEAKIKGLEEKLREISDKNKKLVERLEEQRTDLILANEAAIRKKARNEAARVRLFATDIYNTINEYIIRKKIITDSEWTEVDRVVNQEIENFRVNLYSYYNISLHEYHICLLIRMGIQPKDMANLLGCTTSAVSKARKRLQEKFFGDSGSPKDFDAFVNSL